MFYQNHSLALNVVEIFRNLILINIIKVEHEKFRAALLGSSKLFNIWDLNSKNI